MKIFATCFLMFTGAVAFAAAPPEQPKNVLFTGDATSAFAAGAAIPAGRATFLISGVLPAPIKKDGATAYDRYGDTYLQSVSCLKRITEALSTQGLTLRDVVFLRVYVVSDAGKGGRPD